MGGIPWQSKGCKNCKKRKIRCDGGKPECVRCIKRGLTCLGYDNHPNFVGAPSVKRRSMSEESCIEAISPRPSVTQFMPNSPHCGPTMRDLMLSTFLHTCFPDERPTSRVHLGQFLLCSIAGLPQKGLMVDKALSALSCLFVGNINQDPQIFHHGVNLYNDAIRRLSFAICRNDSYHDIIYTAYIFQEVEGIHCPDGLQKWMSHIQGMNAILTHYESKVSDNPITDIIYKHRQKMNIIVSSVGMCLSPQEYEYIMQPTEGNPLLELAQILADIGPLLATVRNFEYLQLETCQEILYECYALKRRLLAAHEAGHFGDMPFECSSTEFDSPGVPATEDLFGSGLLFVSQDNAMLHMLYWGLLNMVHSLIYTVSCSLGSFGQEASPSPPSDDQNLLLAAMYADRIARAVPYCTQKHLKHTSYRMLIFVLAVAATNFIDSGNWEKYDWALKILNQVASNGYGIGARVGEMLRATWDNREEFPNKHVICIYAREETARFVAPYSSPAGDDLFESEYKFSWEARDSGICV
ncbi:hypothetical protein N7456_011532 [Penicillium angulare]|uniref:Zn(2)-C6 fungal-type domain-containing protein n=1 Tax=Penicillium angulare TaxID=116970 RepID=A0A9W9K094_9EURO|nr:hypothetical protein N7456_011532 [Penicillium angulare]